MPYARTDLPKEAVSINGVYIEDIISGYYTITSEGREMLEKELTTIKGIADGETLLRSRVPARTITVDFVLHKDSLPNLRTAWNTLAGILNAENAKIIFNDEPDKYFIGSTLLSGNLQKALNAGVCSYKIYCADPFKYELVETEVNTSVITVDGESVTALTTENDGTYSAYPSFEITFGTDVSASGVVGRNADCGFVQLAKGDYSIQFGDDEEKDSSSVVLVNQDFRAGAGSFAQANNTPVLDNSLKYEGTASRSTSNGFYASAYGSTATDFHGPLVLCTLPSSIPGAFTLTWKNILACHKTTKTGNKQCGSFFVILYTKEGSALVPAYAYGYEKTATNKLTGSTYKYTGTGLTLISNTVNMGYSGNGGYSGTAAKLSTNKIWRYREDGEWKLGFKTNDYVAEGQAASSTCPVIYAVGFFFGQYKQVTALAYNRLIEASITDGDYDVINTFGSGDNLKVDCADMSILLNEQTNPDIGDIANDWENMVIDVGANVIYCAWSDWVTSGYEPNIVMRYRKRYL